MTIAMNDKVTISRYAELSGYTPGAIRKKIARGFWLEDAQWFRAPDGRIMISIAGVESWVEGQECASLVPKQSKSTSGGKTRDTARVYDLHRRRQTSSTADDGSDGSRTR